MCDIETLRALRLFVNERLSAAAEDILAVFVSTIVQYQQQIDVQVVQQQHHRHGVTSDLADVLPVCGEGVSPDQQERRPDLLREEPQPPQIEEEETRPEEAEEGSMLTILAVESVYSEHRETEPLASTLAEHVKTRADVENRGASQPTNHVQPISSLCSESDTEDSEDWEETREVRSLKSRDETHTVEGQRLYLGDSELPQETLSTRAAHTAERTFGCTVCGKTFNRNGNLKRHERTHTRKVPFNCTVCGKHFSGNRFNRCARLKKHMETHAGEKSLV